MSTAPGPQPTADRDARMLERVRAVVADLEERRRARPDDVLDEGRIALLESLTGAPQAPSGYRLLRSRVASGATTWDRVWNDTHANGPAALQLKLEVVQRLMAGPELREALANLTTVDEALRADPDGVWREVAAERRRRLARGEEVPDVPGLEEAGSSPPPVRAPRRPPAADDGYGAGSR